MQKVSKKFSTILSVIVLLTIFLNMISVDNVMAKSNVKNSIKTISLKIDNKKVTKKTYEMKTGDKKKIIVSVSPQKGEKNIKYTTSNQSVATVSSKGMVIAKKAGNTKIQVTAKMGKAKKVTWVKIKVAKANDTAEIPTQDTDVRKDKKSIVIYFSCTENTKRIAEYIKDSTNSDIYQIQALAPYTSDDLNYSNTESRTSREQNDQAARPEIAGNLPSLVDYDYVYIGYPIWWGQAPKIMYTFIEAERENLVGKTVIPFCTSASSGIGTSALNLEKAVNQGTWMEGSRFSGNSTKNEVERWIADMGISL